MLCSFDQKTQRRKYVCSLFGIKELALTFFFQWVLRVVAVRQVLHSHTQQQDYHYYQIVQCGQFHEHRQHSIYGKHQRFEFVGKLI